jgi:hypothetical protein
MKNPHVIHSFFASFPQKMHCFSTIPAEKPALVLKFAFQREIYQDFTVICPQVFHSYPQLLWIFSTGFASFGRSFPRIYPQIFGTYPQVESGLSTMFKMV